MGILTFKLYSFVTILLTGGAIINSVTIHEQFYPSVIYLTNQKSNKLIILNFFFMIGLAFLSKIIKIFFGEVREIEKLSILDNLKRKIFDVIFIILVYKEDLVDQSFYVWMTILAFIWVIHQITIKRSEYLLAESVTDKNLHMKLTFMYVTLICLDSVVLRYLVKLIYSSQIEQSGYFFLFFLEYVLISLNIIYPAIKYFTNAFEMFTYSHFQQKNNILMVIEFIITVSKLTVQLYLRFKFMFLTPFFVDFIENVVQLYQTVLKFFSSVKLLRLLNQLPDVQIEDLEEIDNTCLICLSEIKEGKKIGCGHIFHKNCLKELIQGKSNQLCPKCRSPIQIEKAIQDHQNALIKNKANKNHVEMTNHTHSLLTTHNTNNHNNNTNNNVSSSNQSQPLTSESSQPQSQQQQQSQDQSIINNTFQNGNLNNNNNNQQENNQASFKTFSFFTPPSVNIIHLTSEDNLVEELFNNISKLLQHKKNEPQIINKVKMLIENIIYYDMQVKTEEQKKQKIDLNNILSFDHIITNTNSSITNCGGISYGLPKIANYNRSVGDESLRNKIELMNLLLLHCQKDLLLQTMFLSATNHLVPSSDLNNNNNNNNNNDNSSQIITNQLQQPQLDLQSSSSSTLIQKQPEIQQSSSIQQLQQQQQQSSLIEQQNKPQSQQMFEEEESKEGWNKNRKEEKQYNIFENMNNSINNSKKQNDNDLDERERRMAWIEKLQSQISQNNNNDNNNDNNNTIESSNSNQSNINHTINNNDNNNNINNNQDSQ